MRITTGLDNLGELKTELEGLAPWFHRYIFDDDLVTGMPDKQAPSVRSKNEDEQYDLAIQQCECYTNSFNRVARALAHFVGEDKLNEKALEIGAHSGQFSFQMAENGFSDILTTDVRQTPLDQGKIVNRFAKAPMEFQVSQSLDSPTFSDIGQYETVACLGVIYHLKDLIRGLENLRKVTKGTLLLQSLVYQSDEMLIRLFDEDAERIVCGLDTVALHPSKSALLHLLRYVGFENVVEIPALPTDPPAWHKFGTYIAF